MSIAGQEPLFAGTPVKPWQSSGLSDPRADRVGPSHVGAGDTERGAAEMVAPRSGTWRWKVLVAVAEAGEEGMTDWELHRLLGGMLYTIAPRRNELLSGGWLVDSGRRRRTNSGNRAVVWVLSERGRSAWGTGGERIRATP